MNLIFSEYKDISTNNVIDWFLYFNKPVKRNNGLKTKKGEYSFIIDNNSKYSVDLKEPNDYINNTLINSIWYRRPYSGVDDLKLNLCDSEIPSEIVNAHIKYNFKTFKDFILNQFSCKKLGSYKITGLNKPQVLLLAKKNGIDIPSTIITNSKKDLYSFFKKNKYSIINKALEESFKYTSEEANYWISNKTEEINNLDNISSHFAPSIFQEKIKKKYEIRSFFLDGAFFSACIFSQNNEKTKVDFRNYDWDKPNRIVPFKLPNEIEIKIASLMKDVGLNTGSIDLIRGIDDKYYFLEINPVGQYGFISKPCNYNIDYEIFNFLTNGKEKK